MRLDKTSKGELSVTLIDCCIELGEVSRYTEDGVKLHVASNLDIRQAERTICRVVTCRIAPPM